MAELLYLVFGSTRAFLANDPKDEIPITNFNKIQLDSSMLYRTEVILSRTSGSFAHIIKLCGESGTVDFYYFI